MPAGPAYSLVYPAGQPGPPPARTWLPSAPGALLDRLNTYRAGCAEVAGYCNAAGVLASVLIGYGNVDTTPFVWYFALADVPGVTVENMTDAAGRADAEFRFPFAGGVTGILLDARTYRFAGYVQDGAQPCCYGRLTSPDPASGRSRSSDS